MFSSARYGLGTQQLPKRFSFKTTILNLEDCFFSNPTKKTFLRQFPVRASLKQTLIILGTLFLLHYFFCFQDDNVISIFSLEFFPRHTILKHATAVYAKLLAKIHKQQKVYLTKLFVNVTQKKIDGK